MSASYGKGSRGKATRLHSKIVRSRGYCERCGEADYSKLQCAHAIRRTFAHTRTDETNGWCLCSRCHFQIDQHPDQFMDWVEQSIGREEFDRLKLKANQGVGKKMDWDAEAARLAALWAEVA